MDIDYRINALIRLKKRFFFLFSKHLEIYNKLVMAIKGGYEGRNILTPKFIERVNFTSKLLNDKWLKDKQSRLSCISSNSDIAMDGYALIGMSGEGKSAGVNSILTTIPQVIVHKEYGGRKILFYQLVWLKIDCTSKASIKQLCNKFFQEVDRVLGTEYLRKYGGPRFSVDNMIIAMAHITQIHGLGALIIDEIQHLATSKTGVEEVLNFLVTIKNEMKIPIIYIGTFKTINNVLGKSYTQARRASGLGEVIWGPMEKDKEWDSFISRMWKYQWTKQTCPLSEDIGKVFYENTMGITDRAIKLFIAVQLEAIIHDCEKITANQIKRVAEKNMPLTSDMIKALRDKDIAKLAAYDDINTFDIEKHIDEVKRKKEYQKRLQEEKENVIYRISQKKQEIENELVLLMLRKGISEKTVERIVNAVIKEHGVDKDMDFYETEIGKRIDEVRRNKKDVSKKETKKSEFQNFKIANDDKKSGYERCVEDDLIRSIED